MNTDGVCNTSLTDCFMFNLNGCHTLSDGGKRRIAGIIHLTWLTDLKQSTSHSGKARSAKVCEFVCGVCEEGSIFKTKTYDSSIEALMQ